MARFRFGGEDKPRPPSTSSDCLAWKYAETKLYIHNIWHVHPHKSRCPGSLIVGYRS